MVRDTGLECTTSGLNTDRLMSKRCIESFGSDIDEVLFLHFSPLSAHLKRGLAGWFLKSSMPYQEANQTIFSCLCEP